MEQNHYYTRSQQISYVAGTEYSAYFSPEFNTAWFCFFLSLLTRCIWKIVIVGDDIIRDYRYLNSAGVHFGPNLEILTWIGGKLSRGQAQIR